MCNKMKISWKVYLLGLVPLILAVLWWISINKQGTAFEQSGDLVERTRDQLELRGGDVLYEKGAKTPFVGLLVERYPDGAHRVAVEIREGKAHGVSRGFHENRQIEVEEHFVAGVSHGVRQRWHQNGQMRSLVAIKNGQLDGLYQEWHANGNKAVEMTLEEGKPAGAALSWHPNGAIKSRTEYVNGKAKESKYF